MTTSPAQRRFDRVRLLELLTAAALLVVLAILLFDWNMLRHPIERQVSALTGREFHIDGNLSVDLGLRPRIRLDRLRFGNLPGAEQAQMASADRLDFRLHLLELLHGRIVLSQVGIERPRLLLEKNGKGQANWNFPHGDSEWPTIQQLSVSAGSLRYRNPVTHTDMQFQIRSGDPDKDARLAPLLIDGSGTYAGNALSAEGRVESPLVLEDPARPYRIDMRARAGDTRATAKGNLIGPLQLRGFDLKFGLSGPNMALLFPLIGVVTPDTPPYHLLGRLAHEDRTWDYQHFAGRVGDSDLAGDASLDTAGKRPMLKADLVSKRLDFDDLAGFVGAPPQTGGGETASPEQVRQAAELHAGDRLLPDEEFKLNRLRGMDADVKLRAQHINAPSLPLESMNARLTVDDGLLRLDPLDFQVAGGQVNSRIRLDARNDSISSSVKMQARGLQLPKLFPDAKLTENSVGRIGGTLDLTGKGNSVARMLADSNGDVGLIMGSGRISNLLLEYAGLDIYESLKFLIGKDRTVPIRCAFGDFAVVDGIMTTQRLAFDTTDTVIFGEGRISLRDEGLDLRLKPLPKDHSFLALRAPLLVGGSFKDPSFRPDMKKVTLRAVAAAVLGSLAPPAALLAVYETGPGQDIVCRPGSSTAQENSAKPGAG